MKSGSFTLNVFFLALCSIIKVSKLLIQSYRLGVQRFRPDFEFEVNTNKFYKKYMKQNCPLKMLTVSDKQHFCGGYLSHLTVSDH